MKRLLLRLAPLIVLGALYLPAFRCWFLIDDFAWLKLAQQVETGRIGVGNALFAPKAQGTVRVLSERGYFLAFYRLFGPDPLPFRIAAFLTMLANIALVMSIVGRTLKSQAAGALAATLWALSYSLPIPMTWSSAYNQLLFTFCLLAAFRLWIRYVETGAPSYYRWLWLPYLAGFGALELMVTFPALAAAHAFFCSRRHLIRTMPLFIPAALFGAIHVLVVPRPELGVYALHFDAAMLGTAWQYAKVALGCARLPWAFAEPWAAWVGRIGTWVLVLAVTAFAYHRRRDGRTLFFAAWFALTLAPVLPLRDHVSEYYLFAPAIGLAALGAQALIVARHADRGWTAVAAALALLYAASSAAVSRSTVKWRRELTAEVRGLTLGAARAAALHPGRMILLSSVPIPAYYFTVEHAGFEVFGAPKVYLAPGAEEEMPLYPNLRNLGRYILPADAAARALDEYRAEVYSGSEGRLRNVTSVWAEKLLPGRPVWPRYVDVAQATTTAILGGTWYDSDGRGRWMGRKATVRLAGPEAAAQKIVLRGYCVPEQTAEGPLRLRVTGDGQPIGEPEIARCDDPFEFSLPLPASAVGKEIIEIGLEVSRTYSTVRDKRELGLIFGTLQIR